MSRVAVTHICCTRTRSIFVKQLNWITLFPLNSKRRLASKPGIEIDRIRNVGILAHVDGGKTTLTERVLYEAGVIKHAGDVDKGNTVTDFLEMERERGITINSAAVNFKWTPNEGMFKGKEHLINLIDTPGHVDFTIEVERALRVLDGVVILLDASAGVQAQTSAVWRMADKYNLPRIVIINKIDKPNSNFERCMKSLTEKLTGVPLLCHVPMNPSKTVVQNDDFVAGFTNFVNLRNHWLSFKSGKYDVIETELSESELTSNFVMDGRDSLLNSLADFDDTVAEHLLSDNYDPIKIPSELIESSISKACVSNKAYPALCLSALRSLGISSCLNAVCNFLPCPEQHTKNETEQQKLRALVFKIFSNPQFRSKSLTYIRVYSGCLKPNDVLQIVGSNTSERVQGRLYEPSGDSIKPVKEISNGRIGVLAGMRHTRNGDTLCRVGENSTRLPGFSVPKPVVYCRLEVESPPQIPKLVDALNILCREDPSLSIMDEDGISKIDVLKPEVDFVVGATGQLHLEFIKYRLFSEFGLDVRLGELNVQLKETVSKSAYLEENIDVKLHGSAHNVTVNLSVHPLWDKPNFMETQLPLENLLLFENLKNEGDEKLETAKAAVAGLSDGLKSGNLGYRVHNVLAVLHSLSASEGCSPAVIQSSVASSLRSAMRKASSLILEPYMEIEVTSSSDVVGDVMDDVTDRRSGEVKSAVAEENGSGLVRVVFVAPLKKVLNYSKEARITYSGKVAIESMVMKKYSSEAHGANVS